MGEKKFPGRENNKHNGPSIANGLGMFEYSIIHCGWKKKSQNSIFDEFEMPSDIPEACH